MRKEAAISSFSAYMTAEELIFFFGESLGRHAWVQEGDQNTGKNTMDLKRRALNEEKNITRV